jgi:hypothetical protein
MFTAPFDSLSISSFNLADRVCSKNNLAHVRSNSVPEVAWTFGGAILAKKDGSYISPSGLPDLRIHRICVEFLIFQHLGWRGIMLVDRKLGVRGILALEAGHQQS